MAPTGGMMRKKTQETFKITFAPSAMTRMIMGRQKQYLV